MEDLISTDHVSHHKDTSDTADTASLRCEDDPIISAAAWAGEKGGISCSHYQINSPSNIIIFCIIIIFGLLRSRYA